MKTKTLIVSLIACLSCMATHAATVSILGSRSCGQWMQNHDASGNVLTANFGVGLEGAGEQDWVIGFLSGLATASGKDFMPGTDNESIFLWITNYCRVNPLDRLGDASAALATELVKRKGM